MACGCSRLRLGGTTLDGIYALHPWSWDGLWGWPGRRGDNPPVLGRGGAYRVESKVAEQRRATLGLQIRRKAADGSTTLDGCEHLELNQDAILGLIGSPDLLTLEWDRANGTSRYLEVEVLDPSPISQHGDEQRLTVVMMAPYPQWRESGSPTVSAITGGPVSVNPGGNAEVEDLLISFAATGKLTNSLTGDGLGVTHPGGAPIEVNLGTGEVTQGGVQAGQHIADVDTARVFHLLPGVNNPLTASAGTISVTHRPEWW